MAPGPHPRPTRAGLVVSASAGRNKGRGAGAQGHCATGPAPLPTRRRPRNGAPAAVCGHSPARIREKEPPSLEAQVADQSHGTGRKAPSTSSGMGEGKNTLCLEIRRLAGNTAFNLVKSRPLNQLQTPARSQARRGVSVRFSFPSRQLLTRGPARKDRKRGNGGLWGLCGILSNTTE